MNSPRPVRVVDVAGAVQEVEHLAGLGDGAEQRDSSCARPSSFLVVADGRALGVAHGGLDRAVEVEGEAGDAEGAQPIETELAAKSAQARDGACVDRSEHAADGRDVGQAAQAEDALHHGIVAIEADIAQLAVTEQQMNDERENDDVVAEDRGDAEVSEAGVEAIAQPESGEELLKEEESGEGSEALLLETQSGERARFAVRVGPASFHGGWAPFVWRSLFLVDETLPGGRQPIHLFPSILSSARSPHPVDSREVPDLTRRDVQRALGEAAHHHGAQRSEAHQAFPLCNCRVHSTEPGFTQMTSGNG